jgi:hypothetical protein
VSHFFDTFGFVWGMFIVITGMVWLTEIAFCYWLDKIHGCNRVQRDKARSGDDKSARVRDTGKRK